MTKEQAKYFPQTKEELRNLIKRRIKEEGNEVNLNDIDVSAITDMSELFIKMKDFNGDVSGWNVSNVTNMINMFYDCESFNKDISGWDVSKVNDKKLAFKKCTSINNKYKPHFK